MVGSYQLKVRGVLVVGTVLLSLIGSACATQPPPGSPTQSTPSVSPGTSATSPSGQPTQSPVKQDYPGKVPVDADATLSVSPVDYDGTQVVTAGFAVATPGRQMTLQRKQGNEWVSLANEPQDAGGRVWFQVPRTKGASYRVVANEMDDGATKLTASATPTMKTGAGWRLRLDAKFTGSALPDPWAPRLTGAYEAYARHCAAPYPSNVKVAKNNLVLTVTKETDPARIQKAKATNCTKPNIYRNAMVSTENRFTIDQGIVAARVKFPKAQGMHGSVWLQSHRKVELDMIESYGYGAGMTSVIHVNGKRTPAKGEDTYVHTDMVKDRSWWDDYHVYSIEWDRNGAVFAIDGIETQRIEKRIPRAELFVVISMLTSDWEQKRFNTPLQRADKPERTTLPQHMYVDWVRAWEPSRS